MPEGTQPQEIKEVPQETNDVAEARQALDRVSFEPEAAKEKVSDIGTAEAVEAAVKEAVAATSVQPENDDIARGDNGAQANTSSTDSTADAPRATTDQGRETQESSLGTLEDKGEAGSDSISGDPLKDTSNRLTALQDHSDAVRASPSSIQEQTEETEEIAETPSPEITPDTLVEGLAQVSASETAGSPLPGGMVISSALNGISQLQESVGNGGSDESESLPEPDGASEAGETSNQPQPEDFEIGNDENGNSIIEDKADNAPRIGRQIQQEGTELDNGNTGNDSKGVSDTGPAPPLPPDPGTGVSPSLPGDDPAAGESFESEALTRAVESSSDIISSSTAVDEDSLVQSILRDAYLENTQDLAFYAEQVKYFNQQKEQIQSYLTELRDQGAELPQEADLFIQDQTAATGEVSSESTPGSQPAVSRGQVQDLTEFMEVEPLEQAHQVFGESSGKVNEDKQYFLQRLTEMNMIVEAVGSVLEELAGGGDIDKLPDTSDVRSYWEKIIDFYREFIDILTSDINYLEDMSDGLGEGGGFVSVTHHKIDWGTFLGTEPHSYEVTESLNKEMIDELITSKQTTINKYISSINHILMETAGNDSIQQELKNQPHLGDDPEQTG